MQCFGPGARWKRYMAGCVSETARSWRSLTRSRQLQRAGHQKILRGCISYPGLSMRTGISSYPPCCRSMAMLSRGHQKTTHSAPSRLHAGKADRTSAGSSSPGSTIPGGRPRPFPVYRKSMRQLLDRRCLSLIPPFTVALSRLQRSGAPGSAGTPCGAP